MHKGIKTFFMVFGLVAAGIFVYAWLTKQTFKQVVASVPVIGPVAASAVYTPGESFSDYTTGLFGPGTAG